MPRRKKDADGWADNPERQSRIKKIMDNYHSDNYELYQQAIVDMITELDGYIRRTVSQMSTYTSEYEDIVSECKLEVISEMKDYDISKGSPTTYFTFAIKHAISNYKNYLLNKSSTHYSLLANSVRTALKKLEEKGIEPTPAAISYQAGITVKQVEDGLAIISGATPVGFETDEDFNNAISSRAKDTERIYMEKEIDALWERAFDAVPEEAEYIFKLYYGIDCESKSYSKIAAQMKMTVKDVQQIIEHTRRVLSRNREIRAHYGKDKKRDLSINKTMRIPTIASGQFIDMINEESDDE